MSYIGNQPQYQAFVTDTFSGNGSTTAFTMSVAPGGSTAALVSIAGVLQDPSTYGISGTTLTFSEAPPAGTNNISVRHLGIPASGVTTQAYRTYAEYTATAGQTTFAVPSYPVGYISVYQNGVMLGSGDYTATSGATVVLDIGATAGDLIAVEIFYLTSVVNAIPNANGSVQLSNINATGTPSATTFLRGDGAWVEAGGGGGAEWQSVQTANFTAVKSKGYPINTTSSAITVTLPAAPAAGDFIQLTDYARTWGLNAVTLNPNGLKIQGSTSNVILNTNGQSAAIVYIDSTQGWICYSQGSSIGPYNVEYLAIAGAGGGGAGYGGGGGGAGGFLTGNTTLQPGTTYTITVGAGGAGGAARSGTWGDLRASSGTNSSISAVATAIGGGGGSSNAGPSGLNGGSGGGGSTAAVGGAGTAGQGFAGGSGLSAPPNYGGGGGGGAGGVGANGTATAGGNGGIGASNSISGTSTIYAGGGGGSVYYPGSGSFGTAGLGGSGGGGNGGNTGSVAGGNGTSNSGGGGGAGGGSDPGTISAAGGNGGSGVVIIRYLGAQRGTGGTVTTAGGYTIHTFISSGTFTA